MTVERDTFDEALDAFKAQMCWAHDTPQGDRQMVYNNLSGFVSFMRRQGFGLVEIGTPATDGEPPMRWQVKQRMLFIEGRIVSHGFIQRRHLEDQFQISKQQASVDLNGFMRRHPGRITYDKSAKRFIAAGQQ